MHLEFETRVKNGLPVLVEVDYEPGFAGSYWEPPEPGYCDVLKFEFQSGHEFNYMATDEELDRIWEEANIMWRNKDYD